MNYSKILIFAFVLQLAKLTVQQCTSTYKVKSGDYCWAIANNNKMDVATLTALNPGLNCNNLQIGQVLCLSTAPVVTTAAPVVCANPYVVKPGDYCWLIMNNNNVDANTFNALNPSVNCGNLQIGQVVCLPGVPTVAPTVAPIVITAAPTVPVVTDAPTIPTAPPTVPPVTAPPPTVAPTMCKRAYVVQQGDYCDLIMRNNGMSPITFYTLNPTITCSNLQVGQVVCLESLDPAVVPTVAPTVAPVVTIAPTVAPVVTIAPTVAPVVTVAPPSSCPRAYAVQSGDYCWALANNNKIDVATLTAMNPGLNCNNLQIGQVICLPVQNPCTNTYTVKSGDYCWLIMNNYGLTSDQFYALNPGINCSALKPGDPVVIRASCW